MTNETSNRPPAAEEFAAYERMQSEAYPGTRNQENPVGKVDDGGPAFPERHGPEFYVSGMTLRDYFAAQALQGILAGVTCRPDVEKFDFSVPSEMAYNAADAMLKARKA